MKIAHNAAVFVVCLSVAFSLAACSLAGDSNRDAEVAPSVAPASEIGVEHVTEVPEEFPTQIPLITRDVDYGVISRDGVSTSFSLWIRADTKGAAEIINSQMAEAGFAASATPGSTGSAIYESNEWWISVTIDGPGTDAGTVVYAVTDAQSD